VNSDAENVKLRGLVSWQIITYVQTLPTEMDCTTSILRIQLVESVPNLVHLCKNHKLD
jgi:hypothetical protein